MTTNSISLYIKGRRCLLVPDCPYLWTRRTLQVEWRARGRVGCSRTNYTDTIFYKNFSPRILLRWTYQELFQHPWHRNRIFLWELYQQISQLLSHPNGPNCQRESRHEGRHWDLTGLVLSKWRWWTSASQAFFDPCRKSWWMSRQQGSRRGQRRMYWRPRRIVRGQYKPTEDCLQSQ